MSPLRSTATSYLPRTSVVLGIRESSTTSTVTVHSLPSFSIPVTASIGLPISSCSCSTAPITTSRGVRSFFELLREDPELRCEPLLREERLLPEPPLLLLPCFDFASATFDHLVIVVEAGFVGTPTSDRQPLE